MKNTITIFVLIVIFFAVSHSVSADSINYTCNDGGLVTATINITPSGPFPSHYQSSFSALGQIQSTCGGTNMKLTTQNNNGTVYTLIPETFINPGIYPAIPATQSFQSPAGTAGTFAVHFELGVDEPTPPFVQYYDYDTNLGAIMGICRIMVDPYSDVPGHFTARRTAETEASATYRGVTRVVATYSITTDNEYGDVKDFVDATFYPGELEVEIPNLGQGINHDGGGYCSYWKDQGNPATNIQEYF